jgi:hypothetical protein
MQGVDQGAGEWSVRSNDPYYLVQAAVHVEVPSLEGKLVCGPYSSFRGPSESFPPPPSTLNADRHDITVTGAVNMNGPFSSGNGSQHEDRIAGRLYPDQLPGLPDSTLVPQFHLRRGRTEHHDSTTRG